MSNLTNCELKLLLKMNLHLLLVNLVNESASDVDLHLEMYDGEIFRYPECVECSDECR